MVFSSMVFIFKFLPLFFLLYGICPSSWKNACLFIGSLIFYFYGVRDNPFYFFLFLFSIAINYMLGGLIDRGRRKSKIVLAIGIAYNLSWLVLFKYLGFIMQILSQLLNASGVSVNFPLYQPVLPIGISFYTFQAVSYLIDVYRRKIPYERSFFGFGMYISMFPQLIAGPIVTYSAMKNQIRKRRISFSMIEEGLREFTIGLGMKVLIANQVGGLWTDIETIGFESISTPLAWLGLIAFSLQIYFDFYGYSLMAKGLGYILGFKLPCNFAHPYMATSMTEFWRKWHITLGSWFREYVYIPLGGNQKGFCRTIRNLLAVWLLTGLWHGASWNFILWGFSLFSLIFIEKIGIGKILEHSPVIGHIYMLFSIPLTWMLFAITDLPQIAVYIHRLFPFLSKAGEFIYYAGDYLKYGKLYAASICIGLVFTTYIPRNLYNRWKNSPVSAAVLLAVFWGCIYCIKKEWMIRFYIFVFDERVIIIYASVSTLVYIFFAYQSGSFSNRGGPDRS